MRGVKGRLISLKLQPERHLAKDEAEDTGILMERGLVALSHILSTDGNDGEQQWTIFITGKLSRYDPIYIIITLNKSTQMLYLKGQNTLIRLI